MSARAHVIAVALLSLAEAAGLPAALAIVCVACGLVAAGAGNIPPPHAILGSPQAVTSETITRNQEATHA
jgi:hypothetical protein